MISAKEKISQDDWLAEATLDSVREDLLVDKTSPVKGTRYCDICYESNGDQNKPTESLLSSSLSLEGAKDERLSVN